MSDYYSRRNLDFLLNEVFDLDSILDLEIFRNHDRESVKMMLDAAGKLADKEMRPYLTEMDRKEPVFEKGKVAVHPQVRSLMKKFGEGGWISANALEADGGQQVPGMVTSCAQFIFGAANFSASVYPYLSAGVSRILEDHGSEQLKEEYLPKLHSGAWQGTMAMTEPDAGSSLADLKTTAEPLDDQGTIFSIRGQKIFISAGDHDGVGNVVHLVLARIKGAPEGIKGLSLFLVPQKRTNAEDQIILNDVTTTGMFKKMGYKGAPIVQLSFGEKKRCFGYLIGKPSEGISLMFQMMNEARIGVGLSATSISSAAYYASLNYAKERVQGRFPDEKDPAAPQRRIIEHSDIKRMLLFQKSITEGSLALLIQCALYADMAKGGKEEIKEIYRLTLDLLTPVAKSFPSEMGVQTTAAAIQILGGAGYCQDFPVEQFYREMKINSIHEGTTGIHAIDLLGRKIIMGGGIAFRAFTEEVSKTIKKIKLELPELSKFGEKLNDSLFRLQNVTMRLSTLAMKEKKEVFLMDATLYLELFGIVAVGWQWLLQAVPCQIAINENRQDEFYESKMLTMRYYFEYELPKAESIITRLNSSDRLLLEIRQDHLQ
jgi:alkylation response protein AidB-like acyl-CoA dehydrogenase